MNSKKVTLIIIVLFVFNGSVRADLLEALRANDARFDNAKLNYTQTYTQIVKQDPFHFAKTGDDPSKISKDYWEPRKYKLVNDCWLLVRGENAVLSTQYEPTSNAEYKYNDIRRQYQRLANLSGVYYELCDSQLPDNDSGKNTPNYEKQLRIRKLNSPLGGLHDTRMAIEFAHGIGFGKRIKNISSTTRRGELTIIRGVIQIWSEDLSMFEIEVDDNQLVRRAAVTSDVKGNITRFEISTEGTVHRKGFKLAKSGTFKRILLGSAISREQAKPPKIRKDFTVRFGSIEMDLSQARYDELTEFKIEPLMQVTDSVKGVRGTGPGCYDKKD